MKNRDLKMVFQAVSRLHKYPRVVFKECPATYGGLCLQRFAAASQSADQIESAPSTVSVTSLIYRSSNTCPLCPPVPSLARSPPWEADVLTLSSLLPLLQPAGDEPEPLTISPLPFDLFTVFFFLFSPRRTCVDTSWFYKHLLASLHPPI